MTGKPRIAKHRGQWFVSRGWWIGEKADTVKQAWVNWTKLLAAAQDAARVASR